MNNDVNSKPRLFRIPIKLDFIDVSALIDMGSIASLCSEFVFNRLDRNKLIKINDPPKNFIGASGESIEILGVYDIPIVLQDDHTVVHPFHVVRRLAESVLLGIDFLVKHNFSFEGGTRKLSYSIADKNYEIINRVGENIPVSEPSSIEKPDLSHLSPHERKMLENLIEGNRHVFAQSLAELGTAVGVEHAIETTGEIIAIPPYNTPYALRGILKDQIDEFLRCGIIEPSNSPYSSSIVMVRKRDTSEYRLTCDWRKLNSITRKDRYPGMLFNDVIDALYGAQYFSVIDLHNAYFQINLRKSDRCLSAFTCFYGHFQFIKMGQGLCNGPATMQRLLNNILKDVLFKFTLAFFDDVLVYSKTFADHIHHLQRVFTLLYDAGLKLKYKKCTFGMPSVRYLGFIISRNGLSTESEKVEAIAKFKTPTKIDHIRSYVGAASFYRRFVKNFSNIVHPLVKLTRKNVKFQWGPEQQAAFDCIKEKLTTAPVLYFVDFSRPLILRTDASDYGIGSVLGQIQRDPITGEEREGAIAFFSKGLIDRQLTWTTCEKELFAIIASVKTFHTYLFGRHFTIYTDNQPIVWLMKNKDMKLRITRWSLILQEYDFDVIHVKGKSNVVADALSRCPINTVEEVPEGTLLVALTRKQWAEMQAADLLAATKGKGMRNVDRDGNLKDPDKIFVELNNGILATQSGRILVPEAMINEVLNRFHTHKLGGHLGFLKTELKIKRRFMWPGMATCIRNFINKCIACNLRKATGKTVAPLCPIKPVDYIGEKWAIDLIGPCPASAENSIYILTMVEYMTRFAETCALPDQTSVTIAQAIIRCIVLRWGIPHRILSDGATSLQSNLMSDLYKELNIKREKISPYSASTNGLCEKLNGSLINILTPFVIENPVRWQQYLPYATFCYNMSVNATTKESPAYLMYQWDPTEPCDLQPSSRIRFLTDNETLFSDPYQRTLQLARNHTLESQENSKLYYDEENKVTLTKYNVGDLIFMRESKVQTGKFYNRWSGPYEVVRKQSDLNYVVKSDKLRPVPFTIHVNRMKKYKVKEPTTTASAGNPSGETLAPTNVSTKAQQPVSPPETSVDSPLQAKKNKKAPAPVPIDRPRRTNVNVPLRYRNDQ